MDGKIQLYAQYTKTMERKINKIKVENDWISLYC